jgi:histidine triad (HIT) family protein
MKNENCIFCKIVAGEIPSFKVYEDDNFFGFLTIKPHTKGHTLLIPKIHVEEILVSSDETSTELFRSGKDLAKKIKDIFNSDKVAFVLAGQGVPHLHLHLIPMNHETDLDPHIAKDADFAELVDTQKLFS